MKGFDTKALLLFPKIESYERRGYQYHHQFKTAVVNLVNYLTSVGIEAHAFYTDDVAREMRDKVDLKFVSTLTTTDKFFTSKYCDGMRDALELKMIEFPDIYNAITAKDPGSLDMSTEARFDMVLRHNAKAVAKIIPTYKIVIHFMIPNNTQYKVTSKPGDGKIRVHVSANTFIPTVYMSGQEENPIDIFGVGYANRGLDMWGA